MWGVTITRGLAPLRGVPRLLSDGGHRHRHVVAQLAGTIYLRPSPDKPCYIEVGDEVVEDETVVALLENMKMFNEIRAHMSGRVKEILVENERPVLPGDVILVIE